MWRGSCRTLPHRPFEVPRMLDYASLRRHPSPRQRQPEAPSQDSREPHVPIDDSRTFTRITVLDDTRLTPGALDRAALLSREPIAVFTGVPASDEEMLRRIGHSDGVLVSFRTRVNAAVLEASPALRYVGMCCSLYDERAANVDIAAAKRLGIDVRGVRDYGDEGTVEYVFAQLISLVKGLGTVKWRRDTHELTGQSLGIIGMGTLGRMMASTAQHFGMRAAYYSRTRKEDVEAAGVDYLPLDDLLQACDAVTIHVPRNTVLLHEREFGLKKPNSILVNTSLGLTFDKPAFLAWLEHDPTSFAILDADGAGGHGEEFSRLPNVLFWHQSAGFSSEARERLSQKVLANMAAFLGRANAETRDDA